MSHFLTWQRATFGVGPHDRAAQLTGLSFDVVLRDIFLPLISGATLCLPDDPDDLGADQLLPWMEREQITLLHTVPTLAQAWLSTTPANVSLPSLRHIFFAGEPLTEALVRRWRSIFADTAQIVNLYGPTETTLAKCYYRVPAEPISGIQPVGQPLPQTQALVIAEDDRLCGIGEPGEIVIRTPFRSLGYINGPAGSERRFIRNPYRDDPQDLLYRTGDRGRYRLDGSLDILGRLDHQLKIHGVRVEPDEVAALLARHPAVAACAVMPWQREHDQIRLVAYAVVSEEHITAQDLQTYLGAHLPAPMIPSTFMFLEQIPRTANGKVDRQRLPSPTNDHVTRASPIVSPSTPIEQSVALIWSELLGRDQISIHDNFFDLGGHSLLATQLIARLRTAYQIELPLRSLFEAPTIATVARLIEQAQLASAPPPSTSIKRVARESRRVRLSADDELTMLDDDPGSGA